MSYVAELTRAMAMLAEDERVVFLGQAVRFPGTAMRSTLGNLPNRIEMPVTEEMQLGVSIGMAMNGMVPVSIFPRWSFLLLATNQMVNHLNVYNPKVIVRVGVGSKRPMHPGPQHIGDYTDQFRAMCPNVSFEVLHSSHMIVPAYQRALDRDGSSVLVELMERYNES